MAFKDMIGQRVPNVTFPTRQGDSWVNVSTDELFNGKKNALKHFMIKFYENDCTI